MEKLQISVIIINFNSALYTIECIKSIKKFAEPNLKYNIIVIDNNSKSVDYENLNLFVNTQSNIKLIRSKLNLGFSGGNMLGIQHTNAEYIYFLNNDTLFLNDCLSILYKFMLTNSNVGICTGQMYNTDMSFHHSFSYFPTLFLKVFGSGILRIFKPQKFPKRKIEYINPLQVDFVTGAAMFVDYSKFSEISGFDTNFFLYCEEEDIALRMKQSNFSVYIVPEAKFIHHMGKSTVRNLDVEKENYISLLYYHRKYSSEIAYILLKLLYFFKNIKKFYKHINYLKLAIFILFGAKMKHSLKHKQKLRID